MRIVIFANGELENPAAEVARWGRPDDIIVAANGGTRYVVQAGLTPQYVIGDRDSLSQKQQAELETAGTVFHTHPSAKDETDLELALLWAAEQNSEEIVVLGALGGRPDQELANLLLLALPALRSHDVRLVSGDWEIRLIREGGTVYLTGKPGERLSLIPLGGDAKGVTTWGLRYALQDETLRLGPARGVSNVFATREVKITLGAGLLWCFHEKTM